MCVKHSVLETGSHSWMLLSNEQITVHLQWARHCFNPVGISVNKIRSPTFVELIFYVNNCIRTLLANSSWTSVCCCSHCIIHLEECEERWVGFDSLRRTWGGGGGQGEGITWIKAWSGNSARDGLRDNCRGVCWASVGGWSGTRVVSARPGVSRQW